MQQDYMMVCLGEITTCSMYFCAWKVLWLIGLVLSQRKEIKLFEITSHCRCHMTISKSRKRETIDKKLAKKMATIQRLNLDKERKDKKIFDLEASAQVIRPRAFEECANSDCQVHDGYIQVCSQQFQGNLQVVEP